MNIKKLQKTCLNSVLITDEKMIDYLIDEHFSVAERFLALLISKDKAQLFLNNLFPTQVTGIDIVRFSDTDDVIHSLAQSITSSTLYVDKSMKAQFLLKLMTYKPDLKIEVDSFADKVRSIKDDEEKDKMRAASRLNDMVMSMIPSLLKVGVSEKDVSKDIQDLFSSFGADKISFRPIVAFGEHTADPHAEPSDRLLKENEAIIIDMGCVKNGYCSDMTRTFFINANPIEDIYKLVHEANLSAIASVKPRVSFASIDKAARSVIENGGYGEYFIHRTGHGIGQEVHEPYDVSATNEMLIEEGMIFSIEPGIYIEGKGGVRIEDLVLVTKTGCEILNKVPKDNPILLR